MNQWLPVLAPMFMIGLAALIVAILTLISGNHKALREENRDLKAENAGLRVEIAALKAEIKGRREESIDLKNQLLEQFIVAGNVRAELAEAKREIDFLKDHGHR